MKPNQISFHKDPRFQKWGLYFGLLIAVGFNISFNPELVNIVRHDANPAAGDFAFASTSPELDVLKKREIALKDQIQKEESAVLLGGDGVSELIRAVELTRVELRDVQQKISVLEKDSKKAQPTATSTKETSSSDVVEDGTAKIIDLEKEDSRIAYFLRVTRSGDKLFIQPQKKKSDTEGTTQNCDICKLAERRGQANVNLNNVGDLKGIALQYMKENQEALIKQSEKDKKSDSSDSSVASIDKDAKGKNQFVESCRKEDDEDIMDCQLNALIEKRDSCSKYDATCKKQIAALWRPIQKHLKECMQGRSRTDSRLRRSNVMIDPDDFIDTASEDDACEGAKDVALQAIEGVKDNKIRTQTIKLLQSSVRDTIRAEQLYARSKKMTNAEASSRLVGMLDSTSTRLGSQIMNSLYNNENYRSNPEYYLRMYDSNFAAPLWQSRDGLLKDPLAYEFGNLNVDSSAPTNISQFRPRSTGTVPQPPPIARPDGSTANFSGQNLGRSNQIPQNGSFNQAAPSGRLLTPAQRAGRY